MTWVANTPPNLQQGLLQFLQSPMALGLSAGLLSAAQPSMTQPQSLSGGLSRGLLYGSQMTDQDRGRKIDETRLGMDMNKLQQDIARLNQFNTINNDQATRPPSPLIPVQNIGGNTTTPGTVGNSAVPPTGGFTDTTPAQPQAPFISKDTQLITIQHPDINGGRPSNVPATMHGRKLNRQEAVGNALAEQMAGKQHPVFPSWDEAAQALKAAPQPPPPPQAGLLNQAQPPAAPAPMPQAPPAMPQATAAQAPRVASGGKSPGGDDEDLVPVTLPNGEVIMVPRERALRAQTALARGDLDGVEKALFDKDKPTTLVAEAKYLYPNDREKQREYIEKVRAKAQNQVNIENVLEKTRETELTKMDVKVIQEAQEKSQTARSGIEYAEKAIQLADKLSKNGVDPSEFWGQTEETALKIAARFGSKKAEALRNDIKQLSKISTTMTVDMIPSLGGRPNQMIESRMLEATPGGPGVPNLTTEYLALDAADRMRQAQYWARFSREYFDKYQSLRGARESYEAWLDSNPFIRPGKSNTGLVIVKDPKVLNGWKDYLFTPEERENMREFLNGQ